MSDKTRDLDTVLGRARRSRRAGYDLPIIEDYEAAAAIARDLADRLATLPWSDRALLISDVEMLETALKNRAEVLRAEMSVKAAEIISLNRSASVRSAYSAGQRLIRPTRTRGDA